MTDCSKKGGRSKRKAAAPGNDQVFLSSIVASATNAIITVVAGQPEREGVCNYAHLARAKSRE